VLSTNLVVKGDAFLKLVDVFFSTCCSDDWKPECFFLYSFFVRGEGLNGTIVENLSTIFFGMIKLVVFVILLFLDRLV